MNKKLIVGILAMVVSFIIPFSVQAKEKVNIYVFEGSTCPHCAELKTFLRELQSDDNYKDKFSVSEYEVWHNTSNNELALKVAEAMGDTFDGVPYYVIGNRSFSGFKDSDKETIKQQIDTLYEEGYQDNIKDIVSGHDSNPYSLTGILVVVGIIMVLGAFIYFAQKE